MFLNLSKLIDFSKTKETENIKVDYILYFTRDKSKKLENEIKKVKKELEENKNYINNHQKIKSQLNQKINELTKEFETKNLEKETIQDEFNITKKKYKEQVPKEYRKMFLDENDENDDNEKEKKKKDCLIF